MLERKPEKIVQLLLERRKRRKAIIIVDQKDFADKIMRRTLKEDIVIFTTNNIVAKRELIRKLRVHKKEDIMVILEENVRDEEATRKLKEEGYDVFYIESGS